MYTGINELIQLAPRLVCQDVKQYRGMKAVMKITSLITDMAVLYQ